MKNTKKFEAGIQLFLLVLASFAFSYIVHESDGLVRQVSEIDNQLQEIKEQVRQGSMTLEFAKKLIEKISSPLIPFASAEEISFKCCEKTNNNSICQDVLQESQCQASAQISFSSCAQTSFCKKGCCADLNEGTYDKNTPQILCSGTWYDDVNCNLPGARFGCCVLGQRTQFVTQQQCVKMTSNLALSNSSIVDWRNLNEAQCAILSQIQERGACVFNSNNEKTCKMTTKQECISLTSSSSNFYEKALCTAQELGTNCVKTDKTTCLDGKDGAYFVDSCGNAANIYDSNKLNDNDYWKKVYSLDESCGSGKGNSNSASCGNCNRFLGGICASAKAESFSVTNGDFYCKSTACTFEGESYKNGESWCVYDGKIGDGDDVVGSRHWKYVCNLGQVQVEPCADYRNQICVQSNTFDVNGTNVEFKNAACRTNNGRSCISINSEKDAAKKCADTLDCEIKNINMDGSFNFNVCVPIYPPGFHLTNENQQKMAEQVCGMASQTCTIQYKQTFMGSCEVIDNGDCDTSKFTQDMNDLCRKLGDCGLEVNIEGKYDLSNPSYSVSKAPKLAGTYIQNLIKFANPEDYKGQYAEVGNVTEYLEAAGLWGSPGSSSEDGGSGGGINPSTIGAGVLGAGAAAAVIAAVIISIESGGAIGFTAALGAVFGMGGSVVATASGTSVVVGAGTSSSAGMLVGGASGGAIAGMAAFAGAAIAIGIGFVVGTFIANMLGLSPMGGILMGIGAGLVALGAAGLIFPEVLAGCLIGAPACVIFIIIGVVLILVSLFLGGSKCKPKEVTFTCKPWQAPTGADDCAKCNNDLLKPCSEYRCNSLGAACQLINKGTDQELCIADKNDGAYPIITPQFGTISTDTKYTDITSNGFKITNLQGGCVNAYQTLIFGVNTNKPSQCKFDIEIKEFEEMQYDLGSSSYVYNHTTSFELPDPSHGQSQGLNWTGDLSLYIKCRDNYNNIIPGYYKIDMCVNQGQDVNAPVIKKIFPDNDALISFNSSSQFINLFTNEPSECKYSLQDKEYDLMENQMNCQSNYDFSPSIYGYSCNTTVLTDLSLNNYYIRCKDQAWLQGTEQESERNANIQSLVYVLRKPEKAITIDWIEPSQDFKVNTDFTTLALKVQTSGGGQYHKCSYSLSGYERMIEMFNTYTNPHEQSLNLPYGNKIIYVECEDETLDKVQAQTAFNIIYDNLPPEIARVFMIGSSLKIITTENAECVYSDDLDIQCNYDFSQGNSIGSTKEHSFSARRGKIYYIKCKDEFGRAPIGSCSIIVSPTIK